MGIPGVLKEIGRGERVALAKLAIEHLEKNNRPLRIAIDAAIWNFQHQASQGGKNPALRTLFFRLLKLLALPIHPVFVYDGKNRPLTKRGRTVSRYGTNIENELAKQLLSQFKFPFHVAPGEAEAECALLQRKGIVDVVMSQDVDAIMFGSTTTYRDWSKEGTKGNKTPTHVNVLDLSGIKKISGLDPDGMILVALLSGGDYDEAGVPGVGPTLACEIARAGFGTDLLELLRDNDAQGLLEWKDRLQHELQTNESGYFKRRHLRLQVPAGFPDRNILRYYTDPVITAERDLPLLEQHLNEQWNAEIDIFALRTYTAGMFDWNWKTGAMRFIRCFAQPIFQHRLKRCTVDATAYTVDDLSEDRRHFVSGGIVEIRLSAVPANVVGLDLDAEEDSPEWLAAQEIVSGEDEDIDEPIAAAELVQTNQTAMTKQRRTVWSPYAVEKWWIPQTLLQYGLGAIAEEWDERQRDILSDPKKFMTRKCPRPRTNTKPIDKEMKEGAMRSFLGQRDMHTASRFSSMGTQTSLTAEGPLHAQARAVPSTPKKSRAPAAAQNVSPSIARFFKPTRETHRACTKHVLSGKHDNQATDGDSLTTKTATRTVSKRHQGDEATRSPSSLQVDHVRAFSTKHLSGSSDNIDLDTKIGSSFSSSILIQSSPIQEVHTQEDSREVYTTKQQFVTQRKSRSRPADSLCQSEASFEAHSPTLPQSTVAFSSSDTDLCGLGETTSSRSGRIGAEPMMNQTSKDPTSGKPTRVAALSRPSLPGTWKSVDEVTPSNKRVPRVSYVDLTSD